MVLDLTDEQAAFQQEIVAFAAERLALSAAGIDEDGRFPLALVKELAGRGLLGVTIPRAWGCGGWPPATPLGPSRCPRNRRGPTRRTSRLPRAWTIAGTCLPAARSGSRTPTRRTSRSSSPRRS